MNNLIMYTEVWKNDRHNENVLFTIVYKLTYTTLPTVFTTFTHIYTLVTHLCSLGTCKGKKICFHNSEVGGRRLSFMQVALS